MAPPTTHLAWVDLETTGTDENRDPIIEVGFVLTDIDLQPVHTYSAVVQPRVPLSTLMTEMPPVVREMHEANGLLDALRADEGVPLDMVERDLIDIFKRENIDKHAILLAGSGVGHFDLRFIRRQMPEFAKWLAYAVIDIGVIRRFLRDVCDNADAVPASGDAATKTHRALDDVYQHLNEARHYRTMLSAAHL